MTNSMNNNELYHYGVLGMKDAMTKANKAAIRNTTAILGVYGAMTLASLYKMNH